MGDMTPIFLAVYSRSSWYSVDISYSPMNDYWGENWP
jgi:hypothetical protein